MKKLLLTILTVAMLSGAVRADSVGGELSSEPEPGIAVKTAKMMATVVKRAKGAWLASLVRKGMSWEQASEILGQPDGISLAGGVICAFYSDLHLSVLYSSRTIAGGGRDCCVLGVGVTTLSD